MNSIPVRASSGVMPLWVVMAAMAGVNALLAFNDVWLRSIADKMGLLEAVWWRSLVFLAVVLMLRTPRGWVLAVRQAPALLLILRGSLPVVAGYLLVGAFGMVPIAEAHGLFYTAPLMAMVLAVWLLKEGFDAKRLLAVFLGLSGGLFILKPGWNPVQPGHLFALTAGLMIALYQIMSRLRQVYVDVRTTLLMMGVAAVGVSGAALSLLGETSLIRPAFEGFWDSIILSALLYTACHLCYGLAYRYAEVSALAPLLYFQLLGSAVAAAQIYGQLPKPQVLVGIVLIVAGGILLPLLNSHMLRKCRINPGENLSGRR